MILGVTRRVTAFNGPHSVEKRLRCCQNTFVKYDNTNCAHDFHSYICPYESVPSLTASGPLSVANGDISSHVEALAVHERFKDSLLVRPYDQHVKQTADAWNSLLVVDILAPRDCLILRRATCPDE